MSAEIEELLRETVQGLVAYKETPRGGIDLSTNTNPLVNPAFERALKRIDAGELSSYPTQKDLREAIGRTHGVTGENVTVGNGSDGVIDQIFKTFINPRERAVIPTPTFEMYGLIGRVNLAQMVEVPLTSDFQLDVDRVLGGDGKITIVCRPNNPTGNVFPREDVTELLDRSRGLVVIDEAYADFMGQEDFVSEVGDYDNLIILRTFSKAHGLAGIRVGYALGSEEIIADLDRVRLPYNVNVISVSIALEALRDAAFVDRSRRLVLAERGRMKEEMERLGVLVYPSDTNFLLAKLPINAAEFCKALLGRGIRVKDCSGWPMLRNCVRITIGTPPVNERFLAYMREILK